MTLREYVSFLENRSDASVAKKKLHYGYLPLDVNEVYLNFSATLPEVLDGKVDHMGSVFLLGGALMGTPPHHHGPAVNSLRTKGAPSSRRCLQEPGDLLFVPRGWTHSTLCLSDCVAVSLELSHQIIQAKLSFDPDPDNVLLLHSIAAEDDSPEMHQRKQEQEKAERARREQKERTAILTLEECTMETVKLHTEE
eukprot:g1307.t1